MKYCEYIEKIDREDITIHIPENVNFDEELVSPILLISHELTRTGAPLQLQLLGKSLFELEYTPVVLSLSEGDLLNDFMEMGLTVICANSSTMNIEWICSLTEMFDTIFANTLVLAPIIRYMAPKAGRIFWWIHENSYWYSRTLCENIPAIPSLKILGASPKTIQFIENNLCVHADLLNVSTLDYGYSFEKRNERTTFLWAGSIDTNKAIDVFFEAILDMPQEDRKNATFIICGNNKPNGDYYGLVNNFIEHLSNVFYLGNIPHEELMALMDEVDSVVISSLEETTSMMAVEGLMKGKIVICSDGCGVTSFMHDGVDSFIFPTKDHEALSKIMSFVINEPSDFLELRERARRVFENFYTYDFFKNNVQELLDNSEIINKRMNLCSGCGACALSCPFNAIEMKRNARGFEFPHINRNKCVGCGICKNVCEVNSPGINFDEMETFAFQLKDDTKRLESQSGGAFSAFAEVVLDEKGIVFGASLVDDRHVEYIGIEKIEDLRKIKGSKYVQAKTGKVFERVKENLVADRKVLFGGTSCHVDGLLHYLKDVDTSNLITVDIVCHGVPSPFLFERYIDELMLKGGEIKQFNFRNKPLAGWRSCYETWLNKDNKLQYSQDYKNLYFSDLALRECCYSCKYACFQKPADITVADFWGIEKVMPEIDDSKGTSLVISHTEKGLRLLNMVGDNARFFSVEESLCTQNNLVAPTKRPNEVDIFWNQFKEKPFKYLMQSFTGAGANRLFDMSISEYISSENIVERIVEYEEKEQKIVDAICGKDEVVERILNLMNEKVIPNPHVLTVFGKENGKKGYSLAADKGISIEEYLSLRSDESVVLVADGTNCVTYIELLVEQKVEPEKILPISFIIEEEV